MEVDIKDKLLEDYKFLLANMEKSSIDKLQLGFIGTDNCSPALFTILIHCMENIGIFNKSQLVNISHYVNKLIYGK